MDIPTTPAHRIKYNTILIYPTSRNPDNKYDNIGGR